MVRRSLVQYNRVDRLPSSTIADLKAALHEDGVERVVLDARHNYGGEVFGPRPGDRPVRRTRRWTSRIDSS